MLCAKCKKNPPRLGYRAGYCNPCASAYVAAWRKRPIKLGHRKGSASPNWKGGGVNVHGYHVIGTRYTHRTVMEKKIGRPLLAREIVHHVDENRKNNDPSNLLLLRHRSAHNRLHRFAERHKLSTSMLQFDQEWLTASK